MNPAALTASENGPIAGAMPERKRFLHDSASPGPGSDPLLLRFLRKTVSNPGGIDAALEAFLVHDVRPLAAG